MSLQDAQSLSREETVHANIYSPCFPFSDCSSKALSRLFVSRPQLINLALKLLHVVKDITRITPPFAFLSTAYVLIKT